MNVAKWLLLMLLALPFLELAAFIGVAATIGLGWALVLLLGGTFAGALILRHAGGSHIARVRVALGEGSFSALQADRDGGLLLIAGILLLIPGFITDLVALILLVAALWRTVASGAPPARSDGVVDLAPEQWHQVPDPTLPDRRKDERN
ncbi:MAG TPA: FxsA family protein [Pseudolabrys sp.]